MCSRLAPLRLIRKIQKTSGSALVKHGHATVFPLATASINQPTAVKHGPTLDWRNRSAFRELLLIRETATPSLPRCPARYGAIRPIAVSTKQLTPGKRGSQFSRERIFRQDA